MAGEFERLREDLSNLPIESRESLADVLIESLEEAPDEDATSLWLEEIGRRDGHRAGSAAPKPVDQVMREARAIFGWKTFRGRER